VGIRGGEFGVLAEFSLRRRIFIGSHSLPLPSGHLIGPSSVRADVGAAELAGGGRRCCTRVGEQRLVREERRGALERSGAARRGACRGWAQRREAATTMMEEERRGGDLGEND
jgi:hypothetical protein